VNKYLAMLKAQERPAQALPKLANIRPEVGHAVAHARNGVVYVSFDSACIGHVSLDKGIPHHRYGHDEFSLIRLPDPAIIWRKRRSEVND
jgi:hypothetical protein